MASRGRKRTPACASASSERPVSSSESRVTYRSSTRNLKRTASISESKERKEKSKKQRSCTKSGCEDNYPSCCARVSDRCAGDGHTSRWYHMSKSEHYCNECFEYFYRASKSGNSIFEDWKKRWQTNSISEPSSKNFFADQVLPYWVQCTRKNCRKWRCLPRNVEPSHEFMLKFTCRTSLKKKGKKSEDGTTNKCLEPEDQVAKQPEVGSWIETLMAPPLMKNSPAAELLGAYYADGVGLSPTCPRCVQAMSSYQESKKEKESQEGEKSKENGICNSAPTIPGMNQHFEPFYQPAEDGKAYCVRPDVMDNEEKKEFPEYSKEQVMYLAIRNLIVALWFINCKKWLTLEDVASHLICRGLVRIRSQLEAGRILRFLTIRGSINIGVLSVPPGLELVPKDCEANVIVIGAGASGLGAARQLQNFGVKVVVLEARNRTGGRIWDDDSFGVCIGKGAQIVTGVTNNPITVVCEQASLPMRYLGEKCDLFWGCGKAVDYDMDKRIESHFNETLDALSKWRKSANEDKSLYSKIMETYNQLLSSSDNTFSEEAMKLFNFHLSNLEYACGTNLNDVSVKYWDQNDTFEQFSGDHTMLWLGYSAVTDRLTEGLEIKLNTHVKKIDYSGERVIVTTNKNEIWEATQVLVTIPLALLQSNIIEFIPPLPEAKRTALTQLGAGVIEKVAVQFPCCFWSSKIVGADFFGHVAPVEERGRFPLFCDMSRHGETAETSSYVLMTYLCGDAVKLIEKSDEEIVKMCVAVLKNIFKDRKVPDPINYFVTRWSQDPYSRMVYSYIKLGGTGETYDILADDIDRKVFFAGEATNRQFPQTVTGSYTSGLREAAKIFRTII